MPRGMDERFENPSEEPEAEERTDHDEPTEVTPETERQDRESEVATEDQADHQREADSANTDSTT